MRRLSALCPTVSSRQLVDDLSLRWAGLPRNCAVEVAEAADVVMRALEDLKLPVQIKKLGLVASGALATKVVSQVAKRR
eukprot:9476930-Pyramimonas_sp.AAC.1